MTIETMKQALEALEKCMYPQLKQLNAITALRTAIAEADDLEAWKTSDTAYRPNGLPQDFIKHEVENEGDWSEWVCPDPTQYFMKCCDCGLVHEMQFNVVKYSAGDTCEDFDDPYVQAVFRARRTTPPAAQPEQKQDSTCNKTLRAEGKGYPRTCMKCGKGPCIADRVQPEQPEQEPVAWMFTDVEGTEFFEEREDWEGKWTPLYTTPPAQEFVCSTGLCHYKAKRPWVGLTEKDFSAINQSCLTKLQAATSAESILKEKNHE